MLGCKFSFKVYAKSVREKATKCSLKTNEVMLDADGHVITEQTLDTLIFFKKEVLSDVRSEIYLVRPDVTSFLPDNLSGLENI